MPQQQIVTFDSSCHARLPPSKKIKKAFIVVLFWERLPQAL
jgi:hypothetical protein